MYEEKKEKKRRKKVIYENDLVAYNTKQDGNRQHRQNRQAKPGYDEYKHPEIEKKSFPGLTRLGPSKPPTTVFDRAVFQRLLGARP